MRRAVTLLMVVVAVAIAPTSVLAAGRPKLPNVKVVSRTALVSSDYNFWVGVSCSSAPIRSCIGQIDVFTIGPGLFGFPLLLNKFNRRYELKPGTNRRFELHLRLAHGLVRAQGHLWVRVGVLNRFGKDAKRAVLLRWRPATR